MKEKREAPASGKLAGAKTQVGQTSDNKVENNAKQGTRARSAIPKRFVLPLIRLAEVQRLALWRNRNGVRVSASAFMTVAGHAIDDLKGMRQRHAPPHPGLDYFTAKQFQNRIGIELDEAETMEIVHAVASSRAMARPFRMTMALAGHHLRLTRDERSGLVLTQIEAHDETSDERRKRKEEEKRENDRKGAAAARRAAGIVPRSERGPTVRELAAAEGVSPSTISRRLRQQSKLNACNKKSQTSIDNVDRLSVASAEISVASGKKGAAEQRRKTAPKGNSGGPEAPAANPIDNGWQAYRRAIAERVVSLPAVRRLLDHAARSDRPVEEEHKHIGEMVSDLTNQILRREMLGGRL